MKIAVGSKNPVKINAVKEAFQKVWPEKIWEVEGIDVESGVSKQPMTDEESIKGATNRAHRAREALHADFGVGLEGGVQEISGAWYIDGWSVVVRSDGHTGIGSTVKMRIPNVMVTMIKDGMEVGEANDRIHTMHNSKQGDGHFGLATNNAITRTIGYRDGVIASLAAFVQEELFKEV